MTPPKNGDRLLRWWLRLPPSRRFDVQLLFYFGAFLWVLGVCFAPEMVAGIGRLPGPWQRLASLGIGGLALLWDILRQPGYLHDSAAIPNPFWWLPTLAGPAATGYFIWLLHRERFPLEEQWQRFYSWRAERRQEAERLANLKVLQELRRLNPTVPRPATGDAEQERKPPAVAPLPPAWSGPVAPPRSLPVSEPKPAPTATKPTTKPVAYPTLPELPPAMPEPATPAQPISKPEPLPQHAGAVSPSIPVLPVIPPAAQSHLSPGTEPPPASPGVPAAPDQLPLPFSTNDPARTAEEEKQTPADPEEQPPAQPLSEPRQPRRQPRRSRGRRAF